jgi:hypothetical protein
LHGWMDGHFILSVFTAVVLCTVMVMHTLCFC